MEENHNVIDVDARITYEELEPKKLNSSDFRKDAPFKYMHSRLDDPRVMNLNKTVIERILNTKVESLVVLNNELTRRTQDDKHMRADVVFLLNGKYIVNFEMQNSDLSDDDIARFQNYDAELLLTRNRKGDYNYELSSKPVIQIIFALEFDPSKKRLITEYTMTDVVDGTFLRNGLHFMYIIQLPYINTIVEQKGIENLDDNEIHTYLLANGADDAIMGLQSQVLEDMLSMKEEFDQDALQRAIEHNQERKAYVERKKAYIKGKESGVEQGIEQGKEQGVYETQKQNTIRIFKRKYPNENAQLLEGLTLEQYNEIFNKLIDEEDLKSILAISQ